MSEREIIIVYTYIRLYIRRHQTLNKRRHCLHYLHLRVDEKKNWGNIKKKKRNETRLWHIGGLIRKIIQLTHNVHRRKMEKNMECIPSTALFTPFSRRPVRSK